MVRPFHLFDHSRLSHNHPPTINQRQRIITRAPTLHPEDAQKLQHMKSILCPHLRSRLHNRLLATLQSPKRPTAIILSRERNPFAPTQGMIHRAPSPNFCFHQFTNPLGIDTIRGVHVPERINYTSTPSHQTLKPTASSALMNNWGMNTSKKVGIETSH